MFARGGNVLEIIKFEYYNLQTLIEKLRKIHMKGQPELTIYRDAKIYLKENVDPTSIHICQYYVLEKDLEEITACRNALLSYGVDIFNLKGFVRVFSRDSQRAHIQVFDVLPPVVELSVEDGNIPLLCDGLHRLYLARENNSLINVIMIEDFDYDYPYYAYPNEDGWENIRRVWEVPDIKKNYRIKDYKKLFRDFNTSFLNVTQPRTNKKLKNLKVGGEKVLC